MIILVIIAVIAIYHYIIKPIKEEREREASRAAARRCEEARRAREARQRLAEEARRQRILDDPFRRAMETILKQEEEARRQRMQSDPSYRARILAQQREEQRRKEVARRREEEESRRKEQERRKALAAKFKYTSISGCSVAYRYDYYPVNRYPYGTISSSDESARRSVWNFKDGMSSVGVNVAVDFIDGNYTRDEMRNIAICVIPASTKLKNDRRYKSMCEQVASRLPVKNGFSYIGVAADREDSRTAGKSGDTTSNLSFSSEVWGKDIILFDDITTRGTSFAQAAAELKLRGARSVRGLFIGKTV